MGTGSVETKLYLAETFVDLACATSLSKITVNMITEKAGKHRKTFYYHFADKYHLVLWLFRYELALALKSSFSDKILVWEEPKQDICFCNFPFYIRNKLENGRFYNGLFFEVIAECFERRREYYKKVFSNSGPGTLEHYLFYLYAPAIKEDFIELLTYPEGLGAENNPLATIRISPDELEEATSISFVGELFAGAFIYRIINRLTHTSQRRGIADVVPYENVLHDSLRLLAREMPVSCQGK